VVTLIEAVSPKKYKARLDTAIKINAAPTAEMTILQKILDGLHLFFI
jgi:hypothetical protein